jgi:hypothetical protein
VALGVGAAYFGAGVDRRGIYRPLGAGARFGHRNAFRRIRGVYFGMLFGFGLGGVP